MRQERGGRGDGGEGGENGGWNWGEDLISLCSLFFGIPFCRQKSAETRKKILSIPK